MMHRLSKILASLFALAIAAPAAAQVVPDGPVLAATDLREAQKAAFDVLAEWYRRKMP